MTLKIPALIGDRIGATLDTDTSTDAVIARFRAL